MNGQSSVKLSVILIADFFQLTRRWIINNGGYAKFFWFLFAMIRNLSEANVSFCHGGGGIRFRNMMMLNSTSTSDCRSLPSLRSL